MTKIPKQQVLQVQLDEDIYREDETNWWMDEYREDYWDGLERGELTWQWYLKLSQHPDWHTVIINANHKNITVATWLTNEYPGVGFEYEDRHFIIETLEVATLTALKWA